MNALRVYEYLDRSREPVLAAAARLTPGQFRQEFPTGLNSVARTLTHIMICEWSYIERLEGRALPAYEDWPIQDENPPDFSIIESTWKKQSELVRNAISANQDWNRHIEWESFPDDGGRRFLIRASAADLITQLVLHEIHHRAQVLAMLRMLGQPVQDIDYNDFMFERVALP